MHWPNIVTIAPRLVAQLGKTSLDSDAPSVSAFGVTASKFTCTSHQDRAQYGQVTADNVKAQLG